MFQTRSFAAAATALLSIAGALSPSDTRAQGAAGTCEDAEIAVLPSPAAPWKGVALRVAVVAENPVEGELSLIAPDGKVATTSRERLGGPPYSWFAEVAKPAAGKWHARLTRDGATAACGALTREIVVLDREPPRPRATAGSIWPLHAAWSRETENLYSAWVEKLFDAPQDVSLSWPALHEVLRDRQRNFLFNHLGLNEDSMKMVVRPDCADFPYFLRAYFAFKLGLPFAYSNCSRGTGGKPPQCFAWWSIVNPAPPPEAKKDQKKASEPKAAATPAPATSPLDLFRRQANATAEPEPAPAAAPKAPPKPPLGLAAAFGQYLRSVADTVHSGTGRTLATDDNTDHYLVPLTQDALRPGVVYADPYGHLLVLVKRIPQTGEAAGVFLAVDAQPDGTVARKRFWRGNFLFAQDPALGSPGFKRFRPVVAGKNGTLRRLTNSEIAKHPQYGDFSLDQANVSVEEFYDRMDDVMSPAPLDPLRAMKEAITSLEEQVKTRVTSIENGRKWQSTARGEAAMPEGAAIFETTGPWEDFSTPSRDLRLLIAMDVVRNFPERVTRRPERYAMPAGKDVAQVKAELKGVLASELAARTFSYPRTDGSQWTLSLKDVVDRIVALEMAYNPNDCVELRWGAPPKSEEAATCKRYAPGAQRAKMAEYRAWFKERRRPPRS